MFGTSSKMGSIGASQGPGLGTTNVQTSWIFLVFVWGVRFRSRRPTLLHSPEPDLNQLIKVFCITRNLRCFGATLCMRVALHDRSVTHVAKDIGLLQSSETTLSSIVKLTILLHYLHLHYIYAFSRCFYPKRLTVHSGYTFFVSMCVPWESNPQPLRCKRNALTTEPQEHYWIHYLIFCFYPTVLVFAHLQHVRYLETVMVGQDLGMSCLIGFKWP